ncbi:MAG: hypothetical protein WD896_02760 [Parcubacteria group bacterium]
MNKSNRKEKGLIEFTMFEEGGRYIAVCLTFDIVLEGDDPTILKRDIMKAAQLHLQTVGELNMSDELLNRKAPKEYWKKRGGLLPLSKAQNVSLPASYEVTTYSARNGILTAC